MADEIIGLKVQVDTNAPEAVGSLKKQLREAQAEVAALADKFGATSKEAVEAAKRAAELKDKIGDAKSLTDAFNPDAKFKALSSSLAGVASGFGAVQGAMGLFGTESKDLEKQLLKVQSAMALSQGLQAVGESIDSFKQLGAVIKTQVVSAFSTLRGAIIATGIGALAVAVGLVITNFESFKKAVYNLIPGLSTLVTYIGGLVTKFTDFVGITSEADRALEKLNKTTEINNNKLDREIALLKARGDEVGAFSKQREKLENELAQARANYGKDNEKNWGKIIDDTKNALLILQVEEDKYNKEQAKKAKDSADEKRKNAESEAAKKKQELEQQQKEYLQQFEKETRDRWAQLDIIKQNQDAELRLQQEYGLSTKFIDDEFARIRLENINASDAEIYKIIEENRKKDLEKNANNVEAKKKINQDYNAEVIEAEKQLQAAKFDAAQSGLNALAQLAQGNKQLADIIFIADKALAIARVVVNLQSEISAYASNPTWSLSPDGGLAVKSANIAAAKIRAGINIATIAATTIGKFMNSSGGGASGGGSVPSGGGYSFSSGGSAPMQPQQQVVTTQLTNSNMNQLTNNTVRAYVVESDVTDNQNRIRRIQQAAEFGG